MKYSLLLVAVLSLVGCKKHMTAQEVVAAKKYCKDNGMVFGVRNDIMQGGAAGAIIEGCIDADDNIYPISK